MNNPKKMRSLIAFLLLFTLIASALSPVFAESRTFGSAFDASEAAPVDTEDRDDAVRDGDFEASALLPINEDGSVELVSKAPHYADDDYSVVRVLITVGSVSTIRFDVVGAYYIDQNLAPVVGTSAAPASVTFSLVNGKVAVIKGGTQLYIGNTVDFNRVNLNSSAGYVQLHTSGNSSNDGRKYLGNLRLSANSDGTIRLVNVIPTAHYLYGIVPYEMSEGCNLEGLKAQAVASRTYAFGFTLSGSDYDITDSFTYQGYRGYKPGYPKCMNACVSTIGEVLFYNDTVPLAFFGASNGGETSIPSQMFGQSPLDDAYEVKLDDIDFGFAPKLQTLEIDYGAAVTNANFKALLERKAAAVVGHSVTLVSVLNAEVNTPRFSNTRRNMTKMDALLKINDGSVHRDIAVRFDVEELKSSGVFDAPYRMYWGEPKHNGYKVYFCRWGHGLGLSQYGADGFAAAGYNHRQILSFYYNKMQLVKVHELNPERPRAYTKQAVAYGVTNTGSVRIRSGPSLNAEIFGHVAAGVHIDIISEREGWLVCIANGILGYIRGDLVDVVLFPSPSGAQQSIGRAVVSSGVSDAALMTGPSEYSEQVTTLSPGTRLEIWHTIGGWYHVRYAGRFLFIHSSKVSVQGWSTINLHSRSRIPHARPWP